VHSMLKERLPELQDICKRRLVRRLSLYGSATGSSFNPASSDLDFLVQFASLSPSQHAASYFGLQEDLERLFERSVDLVEPEPLRNPYFRQAVEQNRELVYVAS